MSRKSGMEMAVMIACKTATTSISMRVKPWRLRSKLQGRIEFICIIIATSHVFFIKMNGDSFILMKGHSFISYKNMRCKIIWRQVKIS